MFCRNCGKELLTNEKYCSNCGKSVAIEESSNTNDKITKTKKNKGKITGIGPGIVLILGIIFIGILIESTTGNTVSTNEILNVNDFYKTATTTLSKEELIVKYGQPENAETWNYTKSDNTKIPLETLYYNNYEYIFKDNLLVRISINEKIPFNSIKDIYKMFHLTKFETTQELNTGSAIRIKNTSVPDFWCGINNKNIEWIKITFLNDVF